MIKVTDFEYFIFIAFTLKFGTKVCFLKVVTLAGGICEPLLTRSSYSIQLYSKNFFFVFSVNEGELKRLKDAFRRVSTVSGFMTEMLFIREVLWDGVPPKIAQVQSSI